MKRCKGCQRRRAAAKAAVIAAYRKAKESLPGLYQPKKGKLK